MTKTKSCIVLIAILATLSVLLLASCNGNATSSSQNRSDITSSSNANTQQTPATTSNADLNNLNNDGDWTNGEMTLGSTLVTLGETTLNQLLANGEWEIVVNSPTPQELTQSIGPDTTWIFNLKDSDSTSSNSCTVSIGIANRSKSSTSMGDCPIVGVTVFASQLPQGERISDISVNGIAMGDDLSLAEQAFNTTTIPDGGTSAILVNNGSNMFLTLGSMNGKTIQGIDFQMTSS